MESISTYEKCKIIRSTIINSSAEIMNYEWDSEFSLKQIKNIPDRLSDNASDIDFLNINPSDLTKDEMIDLGFKRWSEDTELMLIPLWLFKFLSSNINAECIDGTKITNKSEMDNDHRLGCLAYGVVPGGNKL